MSHFYFPWKRFQGYRNVALDWNGLIACFLCNNFSKTLSSSQYPSSLKYPVITLVFKKDDKLEKKNFCLIGILPNLS